MLEAEAIGTSADFSHSAILFWHGCLPSRTDRYRRRFRSLDLDVDDRQRAGRPHRCREHELRAFAGTAQSEDQVIAEEREAPALKEDDQRMRPRRFG
jgi:hypothetical protein